ncbi:MAG TPA: hypothetical protein VJT13_25910 [Xanthobacteraceae bacterium]|nr:hypothetical protein [Xanthobacteraceae bacterium]
MADNNGPEPSRGSIGLLLGGVVVAAAVVFMLTGGQLGGVKGVNSDADLPAVASPPPSAKK